MDTGATDRNIHVFNFDPGEFTGINAPTKRLAFAVFEDAVACLFRLGTTNKKQKDRLAAKAAQWITSTDNDAWLWSFSHVCSILTLPYAQTQHLLLTDSEKIPRRYDRAAHRQRRQSLSKHHIRAQIKQGKYICELAKEYRVTRRVIADLCPGLVQHIRQKRNQRIYQQFCRGRGFDRLARQYQLSAGSIRRICREQKQYAV